jgi:hypothetical protein
MKKIVVTLKMMALAAVLTFGLAPKAQAQAVEEGNVTIDPYYGFFSVAKALFKASDNQTVLESTFIGPVGLKGEYMFSDKMSIGAEFNYTTMGWEYDEIDSTSGTKYTYNLKRNIIRIMPRLNIHFGGSENFDGYVGISAGYRNATYSLTSDNPNQADEDVEGLVPIAMRFSLGGRYYFTENVGLMAEIGLGGGTIFHTGFSFKF